MDKETIISRKRKYRTRCRLTCGLSTVALLAIFQTPIGAEGTDPVIRIEEDWKLVLNEPDWECDAPQFHTTMSPFDHIDSYYAQVVWNYRETPDFISGGMQVQSWNGDVCVRRRTLDQDQLSIYAETITWTQTLETNGVQLSFEILNGQSTTWGAFGRGLRIDENASLPDLAEYSPELSVEASWFTFGSNRVDSLTISEIRYYGAGGLLYVDSNPRVVFETPPDE